MSLQLREMRKQRKLTQEELAAELNTTKRVVSSWERGETSMTILDACLVADYFDCTLDELVGRKWSPKNYADPYQATLNGYYESMNEKGQSLLVESAKHMSSSAELQVENDRKYPYNQTSKG